MKPDLGLYLIRNGFAGPPQFFFSVPISHISRVGIDSFSTMVLISREGIEHAASFDFNGEHLRNLRPGTQGVAHAELCAAMKSLTPGQSHEMAVTLRVDLAARVAALEPGVREAFAPLVVEKVSVSRLAGA